MNLNTNRKYLLQFYIKLVGRRTKICNIPNIYLVRMHYSYSFTFILNKYTYTYRYTYTILQGINCTLSFIIK